MRAGHYLRAARVRLRAPGEADPQPVACLLTLHTAPIAGAFIRRGTRWDIQYGQPDLIAGQELGAPPSERTARAPAHQGQALTVAER